MRHRPALPCPPWCERDHSRDHGIAFHHTSVRQFGDWDTGGFVILVMTDWAGSVLKDSNGRLDVQLHWRVTDKTVSRPLDQAGAFSDDLEALGRDDIAALIREVAALAAGPEPGTCGSCGKGEVRDRTSPGINGAFCAECLDRCDASELADHICAVDRWAEAQGRAVAETVLGDEAGAAR